MKAIFFTVGLMLAASSSFAQDEAQLQKLFEAGEYQQVIQSAQPDSSPAVLYTAAQSYQKLGDNDAAMQTYATLAGRGEDDPFHFIGQSGQQLMSEDVNGALESARQAVSMNDGLAE